MLTLFSRSAAHGICPKAEHFITDHFLKPFTKLMARSLLPRYAVASNSQPDDKTGKCFLPVNAILFAMKTDMFKWHSFGILQMYFI